MTLVTFKNATGVVSSRTFFSPNEAPTGTLTTTQPESWVWGSANDAGGASVRRLPSGQNAWVQVLDFTAKSTFRTQSTTTRRGTRELR